MLCGAIGRAGIGASAMRCSNGDIVSSPSFYSQVQEFTDPAVWLSAKINDDDMRPDQLREILEEYEAGKAVGVWRIVFDG